MVTLKETTKVLVYIFAAFIIVLSQVYADVCEGPLSDFQQKAYLYTQKRMIAYDDVKSFSTLYTSFLGQIGNAPCAAEAIEMADLDKEEIKFKRVETIDKFLKLGIKEEGGKDLVSEFNFLTGKNRNYKYDFGDVFSFAASEVKPLERRNKKEEVSIVPPKKVVNEACSDRINQNEAVNLQNARNQDSIGWCYAYTGADLLSFKLNKKISAVSLYNSGQDIEADIDVNGTPKGGDIKHTIDNYLAKKNGLCLEEDLPSSDFKFCVYRTYNDFLNGLLTTVREKRIEQAALSNQCFEKDLANAFPASNIHFIRQHAERFGTRKLIEALYDNQCKNLSFKGLKVGSKALYAPQTKPSDMIKKINDELNNNNIVGVGYDYNKLDNVNDRGDHASIVVGRRTNPETGACEFLVRNSWGKDCEQKEGPGLSCHKNCDASGCRYSGHFWVSENRLRDSLIGVTYLP